MDRLISIHDDDGTVYVENFPDGIRTGDEPESSESESLKVDPPSEIVRHRVSLFGSVTATNVAAKALHVSKEVV